MGVCRVCKSTDGKDMVFWDKLVAENLVEFRQRASGNGLYIGGFRKDVSHRGLTRLGFWVFLG